MREWVLDHCGCCLFRSSCDQSQKGRFCPGFEKDPSIPDVFRPATAEEMTVRFTVKVNFAK